MYQVREPVCHSCFLPPKNSHIDSDFHDRGLLLWVSAAAVRLRAEMFWALQPGTHLLPAEFPHLLVPRELKRAASSGCLCLSPAQVVSGALLVA